MRFLLPLNLLFLFSSCDSTAQPSEPVHYSEVDVRPEPVGGFDTFSTLIEYPELASRAGIEGIALIQFIATTDGHVFFPAEGRTEGHPVCLEDPGGQTCETSINALRLVFLTPASIGDEKVPVEECFAFDYRLPEGPGLPPPAVDIRVSHCP